MMAASFCFHNQFHGGVLPLTYDSKYFVSKGVGEQIIEASHVSLTLLSLFALPDFVRDEILTVIVVVMMVYAWIMMAWSAVPNWVSTSARDKQSKWSDRWLIVCWWDRVATFHLCLIPSQLQYSSGIHHPIIRQLMVFWRWFYSQVVRTALSMMVYYDICSIIALKVAFLYWW